MASDRLDCLSMKKYRRNRQLEQAPPQFRDVDFFIAKQHTPPVKMTKK
jgi:hypothetical protein